MCRLDRVYVSIPPWVLTLMHAKCSLAFCSKWSHDQGLSDHALVRFSIEHVAQLPLENRPIPRFVFDLEAFPHKHDALCSAANLSSLTPVLRWVTHKDIIREAARLCMAEHLVLYGHSCPTAISLTLTSISRAVWFSDIAMARTLMARSELARTHLAIVGGQVCLQDPIDFAAVIERDKHLSFAQRIADAEADTDLGALQPMKHARGKTHRVQALLRMSRLWSPLDKRLVLSGVRCGRLPGGRHKVVTLPDERTAALREAWQSTFAAKDIDGVLADSVLRDHSRPWDFSELAPPTLSDIQNTLARAKHSAPGLDGLPYRAWFAAGLDGAITLLRVTHHMLCGLPMPLEFSHSLMVFIPKGVDVLDRESVTREATDTRPISLKNSDNKVVCAAINHKLRHALTANISPIQRGFVPNRQLVANVADLDAFARVHAMASDRRDQSVLVLWDFAAAFPSVAHLWMLKALRAHGFPSGLVLFIEILYHMNFASTAVQGTLAFMFFITAGVLQGCPLSGFLFAIAINPILKWIHREVQVPDLGRARACADDLGASLRKLSTLTVLHRIFVAAQRVSGLTLKPKKCLIVPTSMRCSPHTVECIRDWLVRNLPTWAHFQILPCGKYLGFRLGPTVGDSQWSDVLDKYRFLCHLIASAQTAASISSLRYRMRAFPVLSYIAQLAPLPEGFDKLEKWVLHKLVHFPFNALNRDAFFNLDFFGGPRLPSADVMSSASRLRTALITIPHWGDLMEEMRIAAEAYLSIDRALMGLHWPAFWDSQPFARNLADAAALFPGSPQLHEAMHPHEEQLFARHRGTQKLATSILKPSLHPCTVAQLCATRLSNLMPEFAFLITTHRLEVTLGMVKKFLAPHPAMSVVRTLCNGWCTTHRMHDPERLGCVFGCPKASDTLAHYLQCDVLWALVSRALGHHLPVNAFGRVGVMRCSKGILHGIFLASHMYHAVKVGHHDTVRRAFESLDFSRTHQVALSSSRAALALIRLGP